MKDINIEMLTHIKDILTNLISTNDHITSRMDSIQIQIKVLEKNIHELQTAVTETLI